MPLFRIWQSKENLAILDNKGKENLENSYLMYDNRNVNVTPLQNWNQCIDALVLETITGAQFQVEHVWFVQDLYIFLQNLPSYTFSPQCREVFKIWLLRRVVIPWGTSFTQLRHSSYKTKLASEEWVIVKPGYFVSPWLLLCRALILSSSP